MLSRYFLVLTLVLATSPALVARTPEQVSVAQLMSTPDRFRARQGAVECRRRLLDASTRLCMSKAYVTAMVAGDLAPAAGSGHASYQDGLPVVARHPPTISAAPK